MYDEVEKVLIKVKSNKSASWNNIPNEVIKNKSVYVLLLKYVQNVFTAVLSQPFGLNQLLA